MKFIDVTAAPYNCDPTGVSDSTAGFVAAVTYANSIGGAKIYAPGNFLVSASMVFSNFNGIEIVGDGKFATSIIAAATGSFTNGLLTFSGGSYIRVGDITLNVNNMPMGASLLTPALYIVGASNIEASDMEVAHMSAIGIGFDSVKSFRVSKVLVGKDTIAHTQNNAILIASSVSQSTKGMIDECMINGSNILAQGIDVTIDANQVENFGYGTGIGTGQDANNRGQYIVSNNICAGGVGFDSDSTYVGGIEVSGIGSIVTGNLCYNNAGSGISSFLNGGVITGNECWGNGTNGGATHCSGIETGYATSTQCHSNTLVANNKCYDGGPGTQRYGYFEEDARCSNNALHRNKLDGNTVAPHVIVSSAMSFSGYSYEGKTAFAGGAIPAGTSASFAISVPGAQMGDTAVGSFDNNLSGCSISAYINGPGTGQVVISNLSGASRTLGAGNLRARVEQRYT